MKKFLGLFFAVGVLGLYFWLRAPDDIVDTTNREPNFVESQNQTSPAPQPSPNRAPNQIQEALAEDNPTQATIDKKDFFSEGEKRVIDQCLSSMTPMPRIEKFSDFKEVLSTQGSATRQFENWEVEHPTKGKLLLQYYYDYELGENRFLVAKRTNDGIPDIIDLPQEVSSNPSNEIMGVYLDGLIVRRESLWTAPSQATVNGSVMLEESAESTEAQNLQSNQSDQKWPAKSLVNTPGAVRSIQIHVGNSFLDCNRDITNSLGERCHCQTLDGLFTE